MNGFSISSAKQGVMGHLDKTAMAGDVISFSEHDILLGPKDCLLWKLGMQASRHPLTARLL